ncbi:Uncharacterized 50 kDa protein in type I retrotransposable element R1DM [Anthophora quadrimaculata]
MDELIKKQTQIKLTKLEHMRKDRTRATSVSSSATEDMDTDRDRERKKRKKSNVEDVITLEQPNVDIMDEIKTERIQMEEYLFDKANKINRNAIKYILEKWRKLENRLYEKIVENTRLKANVEKSPRSYAEAAAALGQQIPVAASSARSGTQYQKPKVKTEVILVKPIKENDTRNNEQIKQEITKSMKCIRSSVRVNNIRQMRNKGVVIEVKDTTDVELIYKCELEKIGLKLEKPKKINPSIIIYDVEKEHKVEELKEDFIRKNFNNLGDSNIKNLNEEINFTHSTKTKDDKRVNWVVQLPGKYYKSIVENGRVFMVWRSYRIREFINITRCFKCHGYGHIAKFCKVEEQLCITCGSKDHNRDECTNKDNPKCINCARARRKDPNHDARNKDCPEYVRQLDLYRSRIQWR